jgi:hypothetical protein
MLVPVAAAGVLLATLSAAAQEPVVTFPKEWQGDWIVTDQNCDNVDYRLTISGGTQSGLDGWQCEIKDISSSAGELTIYSSCASDGYQWESLEIWKSLTFNDTFLLLVGDVDQKSIKAYRQCE